MGRFWKILGNFYRSLRCALPFRGDVTEILVKWGGLSRHLISSGVLLVSFTGTLGQFFGNFYTVFGDLFDSFWRTFGLFSGSF